MNADDVEIVGFRPELADDFARLNREWIEHYFALEPEDETILSDPHAAIIEPGGTIFFARRHDTSVGTVALIPHAPDCFELAKMAVTPAAQGLGIGRRLMESCLAHARAAEAARLYLITNSGLTPAVTLYESVGFRRLDHVVDARFARGDLEMELVFERTASPVTGRS